MRSANSPTVMLSSLLLSALIGVTRARPKSQAKRGSGKGRASAYGAKLHKRSAEVSSLGRTRIWLTILSVTP